MSVTIDKLGPHGILVWCREDFWTLHCVRRRDDGLWWYEEWHKLIGIERDTCQLYTSRAYEKLERAKRKLNASVPSNAKVVRCRR